jgi:hypothetical protein
MLAGLASCRQAEPHHASSSRTSTSPTATVSRAGHVDSVVSREEALRRFRADLRDPPVALSGDHRTREALVRQLVYVLAQRDTLALEPLVITRAEFAYLYYPNSPLSMPPYDLGPGLMWFQLQESNRKAALALLRERAGKPLRYASHQCDRSERQGANTIWSECSVLRRAPGRSAWREQLFGTIIERDGRFKFIALSNEL